MPTSAKGSFNVCPLFCDTIDNPRIGRYDHEVRSAPVVVIGAGFGGLAAAVELALAGQDVVVLEREAAPGGKARAVELQGKQVAIGPSVLAMREVFDGLFARAGKRLDDELRCAQVGTIGRYVFHDGSTLDLFPDIERSCAAIARFSGPEDASAYRSFAEQTRHVASIVRGPFLESERPHVGGFLRQDGAIGLGSLARIDAHRSMWRALHAQFRDPRLVQLFARYSTHVGSSPFDAPATYNMIAHAEREGIVRIDGGAPALARALADLACELGVRFRFGVTARDLEVADERVRGVVLESASDIEAIEASAVIANADISTIAGGALGRAAARSVSAVPRHRRSLSAITWAMVGRVRGFALLHNTVFFSRDARKEFESLFRRAELPNDPTIVVSAQDRGDEDREADGDERLLVRIDAPAAPENANRRDVEQCERRVLDALGRAGMSIVRRATSMTTPESYERLSPNTGGAIYGAASQGALSPLLRPSARTRLPGLFVAGGSVHPGPGIAMATLSGMIAARAVLSTLGGTQPADERDEAASA